MLCLYIVQSRQQRVALALLALTVVVALGAAAHSGGSGCKQLVVCFCCLFCRPTALATRCLSLRIAPSLWAPNDTFDGALFALVLVCCVCVCARALADEFTDEFADEFVRGSCSPCLLFVGLVDVVPSSVF